MITNVLLCLSLSRLHSNNLHCDCHLSWLSDWLRARRGMAPFTQCMAPAHMRGLNVPEVQKKDFVCNGELTLTRIRDAVQTLQRFNLAEGHPEEDPILSVTCTVNVLLVHIIRYSCYL